MSAANTVLWLGSVQPGVAAGSHEVSDWLAKSMSSAWPPSPASAGLVPVLGELDPGVGSPATLPDAISWRTSLAVIGQAVPSTLVQSGAGFSLPSAMAFIAAL